ncbi:hypothetical protein [Gottfriedia acidiceleris]|uniref:hypothetical protein n=1 Tax=Gottfriedia acidiceleris TaxID=371036 RepID=UPI003000A2B9
MNTGFEVFHYDPNFMFSMNSIPGRVKLIFCTIRKDTSYDRTIFIIQNGIASAIN